MPVVKSPSRRRGIASRIFFAQWINTAIIVVLINADLRPYIPPISILYDMGILSGSYTDTNEDWYVVVGASIVGQSVSASLVPNFAVLANWPVSVARQQLLKNRQLTTKRLNQLFEGAEYLLSARYAALLNIMWVILTYSSAIPLMNFFGVVFFSTAYWCDKIALLRACRRPAQYDEKLAVLCTTLMSLGMLVHLGFSLWFFGFLVAEMVAIPFIQNIPLPQVLRERCCWGGVGARTSRHPDPPPPTLPQVIGKRLLRKPASTVLFFFMGYLAFEILARYVTSGHVSLPDVATNDVSLPDSLTMCR